MSTESAVHACAGWFGKIPARGDFLTRNLPASFVEPWDEWLCAELSEARIQLAEAWDAIWRDAPVWCFSLGERTVDDRPWLGVLIPSFDRVGRQFPLTICLSPRPCVSGTRAREWCGALVAVGLHALGRDGSPETLDNELAQFMRTPYADTTNSESEEQTSTDPGTSCWWTWHNGHAGPQQRFSPLPRGACFRGLLCARQDVEA
jgi:type VI secretion system ImpM family protein